VFDRAITDATGGLMGQMRILDSSGDTIVDWRVDDAASVREAEELFARLTAERKVAFARPAGAPAEQSTRVKRFTPDAEEIIWVRPIQGG
jgi:hypothetical protein